MSNVVDLRRVAATQRALNEERIAGLNALEAQNAASRFNVLRTALEAMVAYARLDGPDEARKLAELAITRAAKKE